MNRVDLRQRRNEVGRLIARYGFDWLWSRSGIGNVISRPEKAESEAKSSHLTQPVRLRMLLEELGTVAIKLGQLASTRPDLLPKEYIAEFSKLQDRAPEVPYEDIGRAITGEFGAPPEEVFETFDQVPLATASISQVHRATLPDGSRVVVKVRRPGLVETAELDLALLARLARVLSETTATAEKLDLTSLVDEFGATLRNELDFIREGQNAEEFARHFADDPTVCIPTVYWEYSAPSVLTMQEVSGIKVDDLDALEGAGIDRHALAETCCRIALVQVLDHGVFHGDPHPGNFFVMPDGRVALLDFGMVGLLAPRVREALVRLAMAVSRKNARRVADELLNLGASREDADHAALERDIQRAIDAYSGVSLGEVSATKVYEDLTSVAQRHSLHLPSDLMLLTRVAAMGEGLGASLDRGFHLMEFAKPYFVRFWQKSHAPAAVAERIREGAIDMADLMRDFPEKAVRIAGMAERGELTVRSRIEVPDKTLAALNQLANRVAMSVLMAGVIIGLSVLAYSPAGSSGIGMLVSRVLLAMAVACGAWLLASFWRSRIR